MQAEYAYFVVAVLVTSLVLMVILRLTKSAGKTIGELRRESQRDRLEHARIARQKYFQEEALKRGSRRVDGKARMVRWDAQGRRATRQVHLEHEAGEAFRANRPHHLNIDANTPWGWPEQKANHPLIVPTRNKYVEAISGFWKRLVATKQIVGDSEYRTRFEKSMRHLLEDRYGRVGYEYETTTVEWVPPELPQELVEERRGDQMHARKLVTDEEIRMREKHKVVTLDRKAGKSKKAG